MQRTQPGAITAGLGLVSIGGWLVLRSLGMPLVGFDRLWPAIPILIGLALLTQFTLEVHKRGGVAFFGTMALLSGIFLCIFSFQVGRLTWSDMARYWPVFPAIVGFALLVLYMADGMEDAALLRPIYLIGGFGIFLLPVTLGILGRGGVGDLVRYWPIVVIPVLVILFFRLRTGRNHE